MTKKADSISNDMLIADALLRLKALENLLIAKGVVTKDEFFNEMTVVTRQIAKSLLEHAQVQGDIESILDEISGSKSDN